MGVRRFAAQDYKRLNVWHKAYGFALDVYRATATFPPVERYGLTSQLRRSAISIAANIAEGSGRRTGADFRQFLHVALGSARESEFQLQLSGDLGYIEAKKQGPLLSDNRAIQGMLVNLIGRTGTPSER